MAREYASPELANLIAARLSPAEFDRRARAPLTDAELEDVADLLRWFTRRYPSAQERLAYARRKHRQYSAAASAGTSTMVDYTTVARRLADAHRANDPETRLVFLHPDPVEREIQLVEVTGSAPTLNQPMAVELAPRPDLGVPFPLALVLLSPDEWLAVQAGRLELPDGWSAGRLQAL